MACRFEGDQEVCLLWTGRSQGRRPPWVAIMRRSHVKKVTLLPAGESARSTAEHTLNANSSRSHSIFTVQVQVSCSPDRPAPRVIRAHLSFPSQIVKVRRLLPLHSDQRCRAPRNLPRALVSSALPHSIRSHPAAPGPSICTEGRSLPIVPEFRSPHDHNCVVGLACVSLRHQQKGRPPTAPVPPNALPPAGAQRGRGHGALHLQQAESGGPGGQRAHQEDWSDRPADAGRPQGMGRHDMYSHWWRLWHVPVLWSPAVSDRVTEHAQGSSSCTCRASRAATARPLVRHVQGSLSGTCKADTRQPVRHMQGSIFMADARQLLWLPQGSCLASQKSNKQRGGHQGPGAGGCCGRCWACCCWHSRRWQIWWSLQRLLRETSTFAMAAHEAGNNWRSDPRRRGAAGACPAIQQQ